MDSFDYKKYLKEGRLFKNEDTLITEAEVSEKKYKQGYDDREDESLGDRMILMENSVKEMLKRKVKIKLIKKVLRKLKKDTLKKNTVLVKNLKKNLYLKQFKKLILKFKKVLTHLINA